MALSINTAWEVRPIVGSDNNGGGFVAGATGTDFSQQNAAQFALSGIASVGAGDTILSAAAATTMVGNTANVISGTNFTTGLFQVLSVVAGVSITFSTNNSGASICTGVGASGVINIGGAFATLAAALVGHRAGNKIFIKATGTLQTAATHNMVNGVTPARNQPPNQIIGYTSTRGDGGRATIQLITNTSLTALADNVGGWFFKNLLIDCNSLGTSKGIRAYVFGMVYNCKVINFTSGGIDCSASTYTVVRGNEVTAGAGSYGIDAGNYTIIFGNWVHDNACTGITGQIIQTVMFNLLTNNTGGTSDGISFTSSQGARIIGNTCYGNGRHGINYGQPYIAAGTVIINNILVNNGGYGILGGDSAGSEAEPQYDGNALFNNTSGDRRFMDDTGGTNPINGVSPYTNVHDVTLSGDPFTNAAGDDYTLNNTAGAGAACRAAGYPGTLPGGLIGYLDMGVLQHQDAGGSSGLLVYPGMAGGMRG